jgi:hypothetical protein
MAGGRLLRPKEAACRTPAARFYGTPRLAPSYEGIRRPVATGGLAGRAERIPCLGATRPPLTPTQPRALRTALLNRVRRMPTG